ncbi:hypothetical protein LINPERHAP1_LOCUS104 [Linum perenne]
MRGGLLRLVVSLAFSIGWPLFVEMDFTFQLDFLDVRFHRSGWGGFYVHFGMIIGLGVRD